MSSKKASPSESTFKPFLRRNALSFATCILLMWILIAVCSTSSFRPVKNSPATGSRPFPYDDEIPTGLRGWQSLAGPPFGLSADLDGVAFVLMVSIQNIALTSDWMRRVYHPRNLYLVHIDASIDDSSVKSAMDVIKQQFGKATNIVYHEPRDRVHEDGTSLLTLLLATLSVLLRNTVVHWSHTVFTQPDVFPLVSPGTLRDLLMQASERSFLSAASFQALRSSASEEQLERWTTEILVDPSTFNYQGDVFKVGSLPFHAFTNAQLVVGSKWQILSRRDCAYAVASPRAKWMLARVAPLYRPDALFFANLFIEREILLAKTSSYVKPRSAVHNERLLELFWEHPTLGRAVGLQPWQAASSPLFFERIANSGALFTGTFSQEGPSEMLCRRIDNNIIGNQTYVDMVKKRMANACLAEDQDCRDNTKDGWHY